MQIRSIFRNRNIKETISKSSNNSMKIKMRKKQITSTIIITVVQTATRLLVALNNNRILDLV